MSCISGVRFVLKIAWSGLFISSTCVELSNSISLKHHVHSWLGRCDELKVAYTGAWSDKVIMPIFAHFRAIKGLSDTKV